MTPLQQKLIKIPAEILKRYNHQCITKEPCRTSSLSGHVFVREILEGNPHISMQLFRMEKHVFRRLCLLFREKGFLEDSRYLCVEEQMAIFLITISHNTRNRFLQDRFQHSGETIHRYFHIVLTAMLKFSIEIIKPPSYNQIPEYIRHNPRFYPYFKGCIGAIDGTLINAVIPIDKQIPYRGRGKGECTQNVMAACSFDMLFTYVLAGWEGTAHDSRILMDVVRDPKYKFPHAPPGKYYVVDAGYPLMRGFLTPYRNVRYWLPDYRHVLPRNKQEVFNNRQSSLRNVIERSFGVLKARFPILKKMAPYSFPIQRSIVVAAMAVHNFIRKEAIANELFRQFQYEDVALNHNTDHEIAIDEEVDKNEQSEMAAVREAIADAISLS